jgi:hypothetical protein
MQDQWKICQLPTKILVSRLFPVIKEKSLSSVILKMDDFSFKPINNIDINSVRYINADINYPLIGVEGMKNPENKKIRMIDGRHRLLKQINEGKTDFLFYILPFDVVKSFIEPI